MEILSKRLLARILPVTWSQPLIWSDTTSELSVSVTNSETPAWYAFCTNSGYTSPYNIKGYRDQSSWDIYVYITTAKLLKVTSYSMYFSGQGSSSKSMHGWTQICYSNDNSNWIALNSTTSADLYIEGSGQTHSTSFSNNTGYHKYHRSQIHNYGYSYADAMHISSIRLGAVYEDFV